MEAKPKGIVLTGKAADQVQNCLGGLRHEKAGLPGGRTRGSLVELLHVIENQRAAKRASGGTFAVVTVRTKKKIPKELRN